MVKKPEQDRQTEELRYLEDVILREYDFRTIKKIKGYDGIWKVVTDRGERFLKMSKCDKLELSFVRQVLEHVANRGFRRVARFIVTKYGDPFVQDKGNCYYLTDWIEGKECNFRKAAYLEEAIFTLAEFHRAAAKFHFRGEHSNRSGELLIRQQWGQWNEKFTSRAEKVSSLSRRMGDNQEDFDEFGQFITAKSASIYAWAIQASRLLKQGDFDTLVEREKQVSSVCHGGYSGSNIILCKKGRGAFMVDLDHSIQDVRVYDLARLMARVLPGYRWDLNVATQILDWYGFIRPLDELEQKAIVAYLAFPHRLYRYCRLATKERTAEATYKLVQKLQEDFVMEDLRKDFLKNLIKSRNLVMDLEI